MKRDTLLTTVLDATKTLIARDDETTTDMPAMPTLSDPNAFTTPAISVPANGNNPFIIRQSNPSGTVFIAVGAIVGAILLGFILYHLIVSCSASRLAKKTSAYDRGMYEKYQTNNNNAYGFANMTPQSTLNNFTNEYTNHHGASISKLPLLNNRSYNNLGGGSQYGDNSTIYQSDNNATTKHDLTKMFISPTAEVMQHKRVRSFNTSSLTNLPFGGSNSNLVNPSPASNRHSQLVPNLYINNEINNSEYSINQQQQQPQTEQSSQSNLHLNQQPLQSQSQSQQRGQPNGRKTIPSMYLEDLID
ncbi:uncharacterized protein KGF55_001869 [Candida pseudojiufengensis]|uniref:uncharacterized protein n=1 Tax=Candida pseudojiufengensis TaxID=497109 RepID=UPI0022243976|nr:uncharacterized protein KGF55_001869 [Candida pseudojiufengensis]KAI5964799.1 hypothetical protein KGF55_001869 [Candida pseudojiufengensis]